MGITRRWMIRGQGHGLWPKVIKGPSFEDEENICVVPIEDWEIAEENRGAMSLHAGNMEHQLDKREAEIELLREALWECVKLTGYDVSEGPPRPGTGDWPQLPELAVREVRRLREESDEDAVFWAGLKP